MATYRDERRLPQLGSILKYLMIDESPLIIKKVIDRP